MNLRGAPASGPVPVTTLKTPAGRATSSMMAANSRQVRLQTSEGFRMQQLPAAKAGATFHCRWAGRLIHASVVKAEQHIWVKSSCSTRLLPMLEAS